MEWLVEIQGDKSDLQDLAKSLSSPELCITKDGDNFVLKSIDFQELTNVNDVGKMAGEVLSVINGAGRLALDIREPTTISAIIQVKDDGMRITSIWPSDIITARASVSASMSVVSAKGVVEEIRPADPILNWVRIAQQDGNVSKVLRLLGHGADDWVNLYRIFEIVKKDIGGEKKIEKQGWATMKAMKCFRRTSQSPDAIGDNARHGIQKEKPPKVPMAFSEAKSLIKTMVHSWLRLKADQLAH